MTAVVIQDERRDHLVRLMGRHRLTCEEVAWMLDRRPQTVRCWRSGYFPVPDHTLALLELVLRHGYHNRRAA